MGNFLLRSRNNEGFRSPVDDVQLSCFLWKYEFKRRKKVLFSSKQHINSCCFIETRYSPASDVQDFNSRRPKGLNGDFDRVRPPEHENKSLNGQKWYTKAGLRPKVSPSVEKLQQSVAKLDFLTKCIKTWKRKHFRSFKTIKVGQSLFKTPPKVTP